MTNKNDYAYVDNPLYRYMATYSVRLSILAGGFFVFGFISLLVYAVYFCIYEFRSSLAVRDIGTAKIASAAQGYTEIVGKSPKTPPLESPISETRCLWYQYAIYSKSVSESRNRWGIEQSFWGSILHFIVNKKYGFLEGDNWKRVDAGESDVPFVIHDGTDCCEVDPKGAQFSDLKFIATVSPDGTERYEELLLLPEKEVFVLGEFSTKSLSEQRSHRSLVLGNIMAEWKKDPEMRKQFDLNQDGQIDEKELVVMRAEAGRVVDKSYDPAAEPLHRMRAPKDKRPYVISHHTQKKLVNRFRWHSLFYLCLFIFLCRGVNEHRLDLLFAGGIFAHTASTLIPHEYGKY